MNRIKKRLDVRNDSADFGMICLSFPVHWSTNVKMLDFQLIPKH